MKANRMACGLAVLAWSAGMISCGGLGASRNAAVAWAKKLPELPDKSLAALKDAKWLRGDRPAVVEARQEDLKKFPLGQERAVAAEASGRPLRPLPPVEYTPGMLPSGDVDPAVLLPPL
jgi:hypothetical protein